MLKKRWEALIGPEVYQYWRSFGWRVPDNLEWGKILKLQDKKIRVNISANHAKDRDDHLLNQFVLVFHSLTLTFNKLAFLSLKISITFKITCRILQAVFRSILRHAGATEEEVKDFDRRVHMALFQDKSMLCYAQMNAQELESAMSYAFRTGHRTSLVLSCNPRRRSYQMKTELKWDKNEIDYDRPSTYFDGATIRSAQAKRQAEADRKRSARAARDRAAQERLDAAARTAEENRLASLPVIGKKTDSYQLGT